VSRRVQRLERSVGTALFIRSTRWVRLTPAGARLLRATEEMLCTWRDALADVRSAGTPSASSGSRCTPMTSSGSSRPSARLSPARPGRPRHTASRRASRRWRRASWTSSRGTARPRRGYRHRTGRASSCSSRSRSGSRWLPAAGWPGGAVGCVRWSCGTRRGWLTRCRSCASFWTTSAGGRLRAGRPAHHQ
jgi:hypothetical protein